MRRDRFTTLWPAASFWTTGFLGLIVLSSVTCCGCRQGGWWPAPGPMLQQQGQAIINDPYPQNDIGPYEAASRPPGYQRPLPEAVRNRIHRDSTYGFGR